MNWEDDKLDRRLHGQLLIKTLSVQTTARAKAGTGGLTVALDAPWGYGKSYFIRNISSDLQQLGHPTIIFDAWINDIGEEAGILLMGAISEAIANSMDTGSRTAKAAKAAAGAIDRAKRSFRRAIVPASKLFAQAALRKATGLAIDEIQDIFNEDNLAESNSVDRGSPVEKGLDAFFEKAMDSHSEREVAITEFKKSLQEAIEHLAKSSKVALPIFVFVDELDRCRPSYAIKLLEEIKHLFGVENVCFVVSTNCSQLAEAIRGSYGPGFDAPTYLRRFFDRSFTLPAPDFLQFSESLFAKDPLPEGLRTHTGLPSDPNGESTGPAKVLALTSEAFHLDLRSQKHVFDLFMTVCGSVVDNRAIVLSWTMFLCACQYRENKLFEDIYYRRIPEREIAKTLRERTQSNTSVKYKYVRREDHFRRSSEIREVTYSEIVAALYAISHATPQTIRERYNQSDNETGTINSVILEVLMEDMQQHGGASEGSALLGRMAGLVRHSGLIST